MMRSSESQSNRTDCQETGSFKNNSITRYLGERWRRVSLSDDDAFTSKRRLVSKNGDRNTIQTDIHRRSHGYLADIFVTIIDTKWRYILLMFLSGFVLSWLMFALLWWFILFIRGDFEHIGDEDWTPCVAEVVDFPTALLFSIETQHTIGYGSRATTSKCPEAMILMMLQSAGGTLMTAILTGIVFSKIQRPKRRSETITFSKYAVVCMREGKLCLLFRVGDMRHEHMIGSHIRAIKVKKGVTKEGEVLPLFEQDVSFNVPPNGVLFLVWPTMACHIIDSNSPFYNTSKDDLKREKFELIVIMEGTIESTGMMTQVRTSYLPSEILWGHRFRRLTMYQKETGEYQIRYNNFHSSVPVDTPTCSARELNEDSNNALYSHQSENEDTFIPQPSSVHPPIPSFIRSVSFEDHEDTVFDSPTSIYESGSLTQHMNESASDERRPDVSSNKRLSCECELINVPSQTKTDGDLETTNVSKPPVDNKVFTVEKLEEGTFRRNPSKSVIIKQSRIADDEGSAILKGKFGGKARHDSHILQAMKTKSSGETFVVNKKITVKNTLKNSDITGSRE